MIRKWTNSFPNKHRLSRLAAFYGIPIDRNGRELMKFRGRFRGRRAFVIGNGPSLRISDLESLRGELCFGSNKIYLAFSESQWRPKFIFMEDTEVLRHTKNRLSDLEGVTLMVPHTVEIDYQPCLKYYYHWEKLAPPLRPDFGEDPLLGFYWGFTVTYTMLQWAWFCGIREVYLVGVDFNYPLAKPAMVRKQGLTKYYSSQGESTHFHKDYYPEGTTWMIPDLSYQHKAYESARDYYKANGGFIWNATRGGNLEVFPRADLDGLLSKSQKPE